MRDNPVLGKFMGEPPIPAGPSPRDQLIDAYWAGVVNDVEFTCRAITLGMNADEISQVMFDVRTEDGTL